MPQPGSPPFISPPLLIILLPILALTLFFLAVPPLLSAASNALRPVSVVKTSWDSLNILLVILAILCGVFARRNDDEPSPHNDAVPDQNGAPSSSSSAERGVGGGVYEPLPPPPPQQQWFGFSEETKLYGATPTRFQSPVATGVTRMRRSSSSYPDLRQWDTGDDDRYQFRFFDDFEIEKQSRSPLVEHRPRWSETRLDEEEVRVKEIPVDTFEVRPTPPVDTFEIPVDTFEVRPTPPPAVKSPAPPPPPPPQSADSARRIPRRTHQEVENEITEVVQSPPPTPPTPPSPPRPSMKERSEHKHGKGERRKSNVKREIAMVWASVLSNQRKRKKKQRNRNDESHDQHYNNVDEVANNTTAPPSTPPPPPPPPPPSVFHSLLRKGLGKSKKIHSVSAPPVPPPPPPPVTSSRRWSTRKSQIPPPLEPPRRRNSGRPPLPNKAGSSTHESINAGNQSPLIPAPPPPPPFKMNAMKFTVRGGFVNVHSNQSSRCSSPEREHIDVEVSNKTSTTTTTTNAATATAADMGGPAFCASPDVNLKAATFIAQLRGEWRLEKLNSIKEKSNGSLLSPGRGYSL